MCDRFNLPLTRNKSNTMVVSIYLIDNITKNLEDIEETNGSTRKIQLVIADEPHRALLELIETILIKENRGSEKKKKKKKKKQETLTIPCTSFNRCEAIFVEA